MKHSVQFAEREETPEYLANEPRAATTRQASPTNPFARPATPDAAESRLEPEATDAAPTTLDELVSELEAALMADLHSVSAMLEPEPPARSERKPMPEDDEETVDAEALQRLMESIRQPMPRSDGPAEERVLRPTSPLPTAETNAAPARPARRGPRPPERREAAGRRLQSSVIVGAALVALAGGGAFMTVQSVTAHDNAEPVATATVAAAEPASLAKQDAAAPSKEADIAAPAIAKAEDRAAAETTPSPASSEPAAPIRIASAESGPAATSEADSRGDLGSMDPAATRSALDAPAESGTPLPGATDAAPTPQKLASADPQASESEAALAKAPVKRSLGAIAAGPARITSGVKLRSNPDNGAPVIGMLSAGTNVTVVGCKGWCEVMAGDKRGYVFQRFLAPANAG